MFELDWWKCWLAICFDIRFPRLFESLSKSWAEAIFVPANWIQWENKFEILKFFTQARATENQIFMAMVDRKWSDPNTQYTGSACISDPLWNDISETKDWYHFWFLNKDKIKKTRDMIPLKSSFKENYKIYMPKILTPLTWNKNEDTSDVVDRITQINADDLIHWIEINIPNFFNLFSNDQDRVNEILSKIDKPILWVCGLASKWDQMSQDNKINHFIKAQNSWFSIIDIEYTNNFPDYAKKSLMLLENKVSNFKSNENVAFEYASFEKTPNFEEAVRIIEDMLKFNPYLIKFITMVNNIEDNEVFYRLIDKYSKYNNIIAFWMWDKWLESRINSVNIWWFATYWHYWLASKACPWQIFYKDLYNKIIH